MANKKSKEALAQIKNEAASTVGVTLKQGYNGDLTSKQAGSVGGQMVKKMLPEQQWECLRDRCFHHDVVAITYRVHITIL